MTDREMDLFRDFSVHGARRCAECGRLEEWVHAYLTGGAWANLPFSDGLKLKKRYWVGPVRVRLADLDRKCGPEEGMEFWEPPEVWERRVAELCASIEDVMAVPPLIVESANGTLRNPDGTFFMVADGSHRLEAFRRMACEHAHVLIWFETAAQRREYLAQRGGDG